jgi:hypothetical protein
MKEDIGMPDITAENASGAMRPETRDELVLLVYHPRHASDPDRPLRFARAFLGRPELTHASIDALADADASRLIAALRQEYPDRTAGLVARVSRELSDRP